MTNSKIKKITRCALIAAISYIGFQFLRIDIPVGTERTAFHLGNAFVVIGALLEGVYGGLAGAVGLTLADLTSGYLTSAPKTFILKLVIGLLASFVCRLLRKSNAAAENKTANATAAVVKQNVCDTVDPDKSNLQKVCKDCNNNNNGKKRMLFETRAALISSVVALGVNVVLDPVFGYFYKTYIIGVPQDMAATLSKIGSVTTLFNAAASCIIVTVLWPPLHRALDREKN